MNHIASWIERIVPSLVNSERMSLTLSGLLIQLAEGRQEELTQKGQNEKKELQLQIEEMEEKEQALQARIEALQADNDFTNERLTALQGKTLEALETASRLTPVCIAPPA